MHRILILNSKGGSGKTTLSTNLAGYYAHKGMITALLDYDPQGSSSRWLAERVKKKDDIHGITAFKTRSDLTRSWQMRAPAQAEMAIMDAPAGISGFKLTDYIQRVDTVLIPVLPSPIDIHATAHFIEELILVGKVRSRRVNVAVVANRVKEYTRVYKNLQKFLNSLKMPFIATLRDSQDYIMAAEQGLSIFELDRPSAKKSQEQWLPLLQWLESVPTSKVSQQPLNSMFPTLAGGA
jgi:chromosome partitioning protein